MNEMILKDFLKEKELKRMNENKYDNPSFFEAYSKLIISSTKTKLKTADRQ